MHVWKWKVEKFVWDHAFAYAKTKAPFTLITFF